MNIETMSPPEIDAILSEHGQKEARARAFADDYRSRLAEHAKAVAGEKPPPYARRSSYSQLLPYQVEQHEEQAAKHEAVAAQERKAQEPGEAEYRRRGGWTRSFLVTNAGGHAHRSTGCSTCRPTTQFAWLTELSGKDEAEIVELAGERACTVCYPSAPVASLSNPSMLRPDVEAREEKAKRDAEKAEKAAAKAAKAITMPDGSPLRERYGVIKTEISARRNAMAARSDQLWYGETHPSYREWQELLDNCVEAIAYKTGENPEELRAEIEKKAQAKLRRERGY